MAPPLSVSRALPPSIVAIPHIPHLVASFLVPLTIDAAVYNDLRIVLRVHGSSRPYTTAAMDGAAARGRLDILQWLYDYRSEGCSGLAFSGAASNGHLDVLQWLIAHYPALYDPLHVLIVAAGAGQLTVVQYQRPYVSTYDVLPAVEVAAAHGDVEVLEALMPWPWNMERPFDAAVKNGRVEIVCLLLGRKFCGSVNMANTALKMAAKCGHLEVMKVLLSKSDLGGASQALSVAAEYGKVDAVMLLLTKYEFDQISTSLALDMAARNNHCEVVKLLLDCFSDEDEDITKVDWASAKNVAVLQSSVIIAFRAAIQRENAEMVKLLLGNCPSAVIVDGLQDAATNGQYEVAKLLLMECERRQLEESRYGSNIGIAAEKAASRGDLKMARLLIGKCPPSSAGEALQIAIEKKQLEMLELFAPKCGVYFRDDPYKVEALLQAAKGNQIAMVEILVKYCDQPTIEEALMRLSPRGNTAVTKLLLTKSQPDAVNHIFLDAVMKGIVELADMLLDQMVTSKIRWALMIASSNGNVQMVKALLRKSDLTIIGCALEAAAMKGQLGVAEVLLDQCDPGSISDAVASASANGHIEFVQLLRGKRARID